jgi:polysaccharide pyruvyl transferase WcaK-like protein
MTATFAARSPLRVLAVGDIGRTGAYHVGDESMMLGLIEAAKACGIETEWTLMSAEPARSADQFGVPAVPRWGFDSCPGPADRERLLTTIDQFLQAPSRSATAPAQWREILAAIAESDAVVIAGGGNLCRSWAAEVFERAALVRGARRAGRPVAITGQTIGPSFDERTRELTAEILGGAVFVGMRERHSYELALELGAPHDRTVVQFDDAIGVAAAEPAGVSEIAGSGDFIAVTLNQLGDVGRGPDIVAMLAQQLDELSRHTGAVVVMVPHVADLNRAPDHDVAMGRAVVEASGNSPRLALAPLPSPGQAVWFSAHAQVVVSTRYHPVVFAIAEATPALFLYQDYYTMVKGQGALELAGLESWALPIGRAASGLLVPAALELWSRRHAIREHLQSVAPAIERSRREHIATLFRALMRANCVPETMEPIAAYRGPVARGEWVAQLHHEIALAERRPDTDTPDQDANLARQQLASAEEYARALTREVDRKEADLVIAHDALANAHSTAEKAHMSWQAERESMQKQLELFERRATTAEEWAGVLAAELRRKEADLLTAHSALEEIEKRRANGELPPLKK